MVSWAGIQTGASRDAEAGCVESLKSGRYHPGRVEFADEGVVSSTLTALPR